MDEELKCPVCKQFFTDPVLLPCYHALCLNCAISQQQTIASLPSALISASSSASSTSSSSSSSSSTSSSVIERTESVPSSSSTNCGSCEHADFLDIDKLSIASETDSGVVCNSRPNSFISAVAAGHAPTPAAAVSLACPLCRKLTYFDESGALNLPRYRLMDAIVNKYRNSKQLLYRCQMCVQEPANDAIVKCDQCQVLYCEKCRESCHPSRGPLAKHIMHDPRKSVTHTLPDKEKCYDHPDDPLSKFCINCKTAVCNSCLLDNGHLHRLHDVQSLTTICKAQKVQ